MVSKLKLSALLAALALAISGCAVAPAPAPTAPASWVDQAVIYEVNLRQYTEAGTFNAFEAELPRLKDLGVDILWLMPIHPISAKNRKGTLGSPYSVANYTEVNPDFGTKADFKALVDKAHEMGFKVVLDWVANHSGWDNPWITAHPDWYSKDEKGNITWPIGTDWYDVADLNYDNQDLRAEMIKSMKYWVTDFDIDGFRCDVAGEVPTDFWAAARTELETVKPLWMVAENASKADLLTVFDANYGWGMQGLMQSLSKATFKNKLFEGKVKSALGMYGEGKYPMTFITNHDENSWNGTEFSRYRSAVDLMAVFYFTMPGMPLIYSGQEVGNKRKLAFFEKDPIRWQTSEYKDFYKKLIALKDANPALWNGSAGGNWVNLKSETPSVIAYARTENANRVVVVMNLSSIDVKAKVKFDKLSGDYTNWQTGEKVNLGDGHEFNFNGKQYQVFTTGSN